MRHNTERGGSAIEFAFITLFFIPLFLGTAGVGVNMTRALGTVQLARDAGHMYARGMDFSQPGNQNILVTLAGGLGLSTTAGSGSAVVILSTVTYVDVAACASVGAVDANGNPSGCTNYQSWVFTQRLVIGNSSVHSSNYGSPLVSGPTGVTVDPTTGKISPQDYVLKAGAVAQFSSINPYAVVNGNVSGLPSGQVIYVAEAAALGFVMPPFSSGAGTYSFALF
jgi:hypothetical protein